ncbi:uncharacterized protein LOC128233678 [Mya arenaria]|uniref:uncharacterized protein LOC128233678 n=1 Tax=Mya arenaria TaxID=6604 RepID=UPI0022E8F99C|nr:uncharacterized protein LOC128233678 [Mya arenaria]
MSLWILVYFIIHRCEGLGTSPIKFENDVGVISLLQPTFAGRNVTFTFTPLTPTALGDIKWNYINGLDEHTIERDNKQFIVYSDGKSSFLTILDADQSLNGIYVYTSFDNYKQSSLIELILKDYTVENGCGELYLLSEEPAFAGDNVSFGYFPTPVVAQEKNASKYSVELVIGSNEDHTFILQTYGVLELRKEGHEYIFTLFNVKKNTSGRYRVQCADGLAQKYSNSIKLSVEGMPVIGPLTNISTCRECIVFKAEQTLAQVYCITDGEYYGANVTFKIGYIVFSSASRSTTSFGLHSREKPSDAMHGLNAVCTVSGIYRNMSVEAQIYVVGIPEGPPHLSARQVLLEGEAVDITCTSSRARPPPRLKLYVEQSVIDTNISSAFENKTGLYNSVLKLHTFQKEWGKKKMWCQQLPDADNLYTNTDMSNIIHVEYKYPPLRLDLDVIDQGNLSKEIAVRCIATDSNPLCNISWESSMENFKYTLHQYVTWKHKSSSAIRFNVTDADFGKQIKCRTKCPDFNNTLSNATVVIFPKKPKVVIYSSSVLPVQPSTHLTLTCAANGFPNGNITWTLMKTSNSLSSNEKWCLNASTCTYEMITSDVEQEYLCIAKNEHGTDRGSILVTVQQHRDKGEPRQRGRGSFLWILLSGIAVVTLGIIVLVLCVFRKRWCRGNTLYEDVNIRRKDHHRYQGIAVPSSNRPHESDATLSPVLYDEIDENNSSKAQAGTNRTASATENRQYLSENSNPYANVSQRIPTGTQMTEMARYFSDNPESVIRETNA